MSEKYLNEADWKKFAKGKDYKDAALLKALAALEKAEKAGPALMLAALADVDKQAQALLKAAKGDKELATYIAELDKALTRQQKAAEKGAQAEQETSEAEDEDDAPTMLTTKMVPLLRQVPKGVVLEVMIGVLGKDCVVLVSRKPIGPPRRKLLSTYLGTTSGVKFLLGQCLFEANSHTFVMRASAAGLAKRINSALLQQTGLRFKVRVRGDDSDEVDESLDEDERETKTKTETETESEESGKSAEAPTGKPDQAQQAFEARLAELMPKAQQALKASSVDVAKLQALLAFAQSKSAAGAFAAAMQALEGLEKLLSSASAPAPSADPLAAAAASFNARLAALVPKVKEAVTQAVPNAAQAKTLTGEAGLLARDKKFDAAEQLLAKVEQLLASTGQPKAGAANWRQVVTSYRDASETVDEQISRLQVALRASGDAELAEIADKGLNGVTGNVKVPLMAALRDVEATGPTGLATHGRRVTEAAARFLKHIESADTVAVCDGNPLSPVSIRSTLGPALRELAKAALQA